MNDVVVVEAIVRDALPDRGFTLERIGEGSNGCYSYKVRSEGLKYKIYQVPAGRNPEEIVRATNILRQNKVPIPEIIRVCEQYVFCEWIAGKPINPYSKRQLRAAATYQAAIHGVTDPDQALTPSFKHLDWLSERFKSALESSIGISRLENIVDTVKQLTPHNLNARVCNPDFIPSNLIINAQGEVVIVDNEFLSISKGYEYDLYNLERVSLGDRSMCKIYLDEYGKNCSLLSFHKHTLFWKLCYRLKTCRKLVESGECSVPEKLITELEQEVERHAESTKNTG